VSKALVIRISLVAILLLGAVAGRVFYLQRGHFMEAERRYAAGDLKLAIREHGTAMKFHFPLSSYTWRSAERLWGIGLRFEEEAELLKAQAAYSAIRSSLYAARSLYTPGRDWIERCDDKLASLRAEMLVEEGRVPPGEYEAARLRHLAALQTDRAPGPLWSALAWAFFLMFLASVGHLIFRGFGPGARLRRKEAAVGLIGAMFSFMLWLLALAMA